MKLKSIEIENFMPYFGSNRLDFPMEPEKNVLILSGNNMRGKTSFLNALRWAFYGKILGRHSKIIPLHEVLNKVALENRTFCFSVKVEFTSGGDHYVIQRRAEKRELVTVPSRSEDFVVTVGLQKNSMVIPNLQIDFEVNKFVPEQVSRFFLFDGELLQEYETLLIEGDEQGKRIKEAIENVLGVPSIVRGRELFTSLLRDARLQQNKDISNIKGFELKVKQQKDLQELVMRIEEDLRVLRIKQSENREEKDKAKDEMLNLEQLYVAKGQMKELIDLRSKLDKELQELIRARLEMTKDAWIDLVSAPLEEYSSNLRAEQDELSSGLKNRHNIESRIQNSEFLLANEKCPVCSQPIDGVIRSEAEQKLAKLIEEHGRLEDTTIRQIGISNQIHKVEKLLSRRTKSALIEASKRILSLNLELTRVETKIDTLEKQLDGLDFLELERKRSRYELLVKEEQKFDGEIERQNRELDKNSREISILSAALNKIPSARQQKSTLKVEKLSFLEDLFETSIERLKQTLRTKISTDANKAFFQLTTQKKYKELAINENYGLSIIDENDVPVTMRSAGAEQIVALSLIVALGKTGRVAGPIVMDTPFGRLDKRHRANILRYLPVSAEQVVLLVHDGEVDLNADFGSIWERIGAIYDIVEVSSRQSKLVKKG